MPLLDDYALSRIDERYDIEGSNYVWQLEYQPDNVVAILSAVAYAPPGGVLVHCTAGKDRTGLISALILSVAGVAVCVIASDYSASRVALAASLHDQLARERDASLRRRLRSMYRCRSETILDLLHVLDQRYGNVAGYLRRAGVQQDVQDRLRVRLLAHADSCRHDGQAHRG